MHQSTVIRINTNITTGQFTDQTTLFLSKDFENGRVCVRLVVYIANLLKTLELKYTDIVQIMSYKYLLFFKLFMT